MRLFSCSQVLTKITPRTLDGASRDYKLVGIATSAGIKTCGKVVWQVSSSVEFEATGFSWADDPVAVAWGLARDEDAR